MPIIPCTASLIFLVRIDQPCVWPWLRLGSPKQHICSLLCTHFWPHAQAQVQLVPGLCLENIWCEVTNTQATSIFSDRYPQLGGGVPVRPVTSSSRRPWRMAATAALRMAATAASLPRLQRSRGRITRRHGPKQPQHTHWRVSYTQQPPHTPAGPLYVAAVPNTDRPAAYKRARARAPPTACACVRHLRTVASRCGGWGAFFFCGRARRSRTH